MLRPAAILLTPLLLAACFTTAADFKNDAEEFIETDRQLSEALQVSFPSATCEEPDTQDVGTTFRCTAVDDQNRAWEFEIEITGSNEYEVNVSRFP